jgi:hypothetical protein
LSFSKLKKKEVEVAFSMHYKKNSLRRFGGNSPFAKKLQDWVEAPILNEE